jgi:hypothetical protein
MDPKELCIALAYAEREEEVIEFLKKAGYWDNPQAWRYYGDNENNFSIIGNQQSKPDAALVEKIINSVDAVLMRECLRRDIIPESKQAPQNMKEALEKFFNIPDGKLSNITPTQRTSLAQNILVVVTGQKTKPSYSIIDKGEGQTPAKIPFTFLSLAKSNKLRIPFVQGKFNMGGTGALQFCGTHNLQLIISKRDPKIAEKERRNDPSVDCWGFTIVRRESPPMGMRNSVFKYLAPKGEVLKFKSEKLPLLPEEYPIPYGKSLEWGSFIKLYEYQLTGLKTAIYFDFYYHFCVLLPNIALPILLYERRKGYTAQSYHITLSGLSVRLDEDKKENLEEGFPSSANVKINGQEMKILNYPFKKGKLKHYAREEGVIFTVDGQSHGFLDRAFFSRKSVGMDYLSDSILVIADCSNFDGRTREDLFMNSRDRLRSGELKSEIEKELEYLLKTHQGLRELRERRRREELEGKISDDKPLVKVIEEAIKKSPTLSKLFIEGIKITNPFKVKTASIQEKFVGKKFPTYFILKGDFTKETPKLCNINQRFRVQFETDAENEYFVRTVDPGRFRLLCEGKEVERRVLNLWNGIANLTVTLPDDVRVGDVLHFILEVTDVSRVEPFINEFYIFVDKPIEKKKGEGGKRKPPPSKEEGEGRETPALLSLPNIREVRKDEWEKYEFDKESALKVRDSGDGGYDFYINMDNVYLLTEIKGKTKVDPKLLEIQYKYGMVLIGISLLHSYNKKNSDDKATYKMIFEITKAISPVLLPMISSLSEIAI